jgi:hypothetical protein
VAKRDGDVWCGVLCDDGGGNCINRALLDINTALVDINTALFKARKSSGTSKKE